MSVSNSTNGKEGEKNADYCRAYQKKKAEEYHRKDRERKQFQRDYRKYVSDPAKYEEFKRRDRERKAAKKASELATYSQETLSSPPLSSFKLYATKVRSLKKVENALPNSPRKKAEIVTSLASKFNLRIAATRNKSGRPKQTLTEEQVENGQYLIIAKTNELKLCCFCLLISRLYVANTLGPSIKYVRCLRRRDVVKAKAYIYCF